MAEKKGRIEFRMSNFESLGSVQPRILAPEEVNSSCLGGGEPGNRVGCG